MRFKNLEGKSERKSSKIAVGLDRFEECVLVGTNRLDAIKGELEKLFLDKVRVKSCL